MENVQNCDSYMAQKDLILKSTTKAELRVNSLCK
jgi:hypothetical protein